MICLFFLAFSVFFPCLSKEQVNCSVLFRFYNSTKPSQTISIDLKFLKSCQDEVINRSRLTEFYHSNQLDEYFSLKECKSMAQFTEFSQINFLSSVHHRSLAPVTLVTILAYSLIIASIVFLLVFCTAMSLFCIYRMTISKKKISKE